jgi:predicted 2-oxoglutarate/Fe(II)-dependent dioxygenase YbiX/peroxiredoxin
MPLMPGDLAPWFTARSGVNPTFHFDSVGGRYVALCFFGSAGDPLSRRVLDEFEGQNHRFDVVNACFFGVSVDAADESLGRVQQRFPGMIWFWDLDRAISRAYGAAAADPADGRYLRHTLILDPGLRVAATVPFGEDPTLHVRQVMSILEAQPPIAAMDVPAPVITVPAVFEPEFCRTLIDLYETHGGKDSGFMRDIDGKTVGVYDYSRKRRMDCEITDQNIIKAAQSRLHRRLVPQIKRAFQFNATRIERHIVACYDGDTGGHFKAHRDNTTRGTAHRRFAVTINLNAEEYTGGDLKFPEFGPRLYRAPTGGAVVFSCSLLHEASPVTSGRRYAFLPFLYDEEAAKIRQANLQFLSQNNAPAPAS